ncbi:hemolysin family protein [Pleomorphomonas sp. NRK KF1]|uniref:hemolysin family protein n=1 Tax=Pleomorphomonas sp. NRK KF1 TaxID=2943000 RepID=UPI002043E550|nr:hemolysin family protein [Pleomorphomonas sp. NRK KF1]MCM5553572.1 hemolysin family protein [Pleomorphomonas sp. NRK KF1]
MSDSDSHSTGSQNMAATAQPGVSAEGATGSGSSWLARLREAFGFKTSATLRQNLEEALSQEDALDAAFSPEERTLIRNILRLRETRVADVMVPRADIAAVDADTTLAELLGLFEASGHSRMPVYRETLDDAIGMVHIKDLITHITGKARSDATAEADEGRLDVGKVDLDITLEAAKLVRAVLFVPPSMPATDLLQKMQATHIQMALVIDEYGGTDGIVSIEDVVETIVGEIDDEHDDEDGPLVKTVQDGVYLADARADLDDVRATIGPSFSFADYDEDVDTLGGLLFAALGRIPVRGEVIVSDDLPGWEVEVLDADPRRIKTVRLFARPDEPAETVESSEVGA